MSLFFEGRRKCGAEVWRHNQCGWCPRRNPTSAFLSIRPCLDFLDLAARSQSRRRQLTTWNSEFNIPPKTCCAKCKPVSPQPWDFGLWKSNPDSHRKPRTARSKRALEKRAPKAVENPKTALFLRGTSCSQIVRSCFHADRILQWAIGTLMPITDPRCPRGPVRPETSARKALRQEEPQYACAPSPAVVKVPRGPVADASTHPQSTPSKMPAR
jgi:hypothetical protein